MTTNPRLDVHIPDHEVLRKIGGGAYGEVWLARGVTGAWRAVKVVWREDFEDERGFEREFEGILQYEPLSRDHPGLVNILHVGRSKEGQEPFYYYVMELGDDFHTGVEINAVEYEARTLRSDLVTADGSPLDLDFCLDVAVKLADALAYLHERGLAHRDVKPSNVIFVGGKPKLADIGLVAPRDQRTFVGTEGFVPPEGPGSAQADLYSLGKVLYEMMTGKDRLQFPELPDELPTGDKRKMWLEMNQILCDICEPKLSKRTIISAAQLVTAVQRVQQGKRLRRRRSSALVKLGLLVLLMSGGGYALTKWQPWKVAPAPPVIVERPAPPVTEPVIQLPVHPLCSIKVITSPPFASIYENGVELDQVTPTDFRDFEPGETVTYRFELDGYKTVEKSYTVPDKDIFVINESLAVFRPPVENSVWYGPFGNAYLPHDGFHLSGFIRSSNYNSYLTATKVESPAKFVPFSESGESIEIALITEEQAQEYVAWLEMKARREGLLKYTQMMSFKQDPDLAATGFSAEDRNKGILPTRILVKDIAYASINFMSDPAPARIYVNDDFVGYTPFKLENLRPQKFDIELRADGYQKYHHVVDLADNESFILNAVLKRNNGLVFGGNWKNSLGMPMVPIHEGLMASVYETRVSDYAQFCKETKHRKPRKPGFRQEGNHPVVGVNRADAEAFCAWLTEKERASATISESHRYKVPSDLEWSALAGFEEDPNQTPSERDRQAQNDPALENYFFWGDSFPPDSPVANIADEAAARAVGVSQSRTVDGYNDGFEKTAPVGSFAANEQGLYDLCGNVYEWVATDYKNDGSELAVVRGGSWASFTKEHLRVWSRFLMSKTTKGNQFGFRVVLVDESQ
ncbi:SUMF1/EgtB/PvdO family nonheme iron enzyme [Rubritalea tangerina]|uniref:SUMF1/EgtB/PvdO family nonheme iron enzyme n=1 Tax=Rubritalea tangerina TaxID=430798 RepID=A0ABW4ZFH6_9BACT